MKHKLLYIVITLLLLSVGNSFAASDGTVMWGVKATGDLELPGKWRHDGSSVTMYKPDAGFTLGVVSNIYLGKNFYFEPGVSLYYSRYKYDVIILSEYVQESNPKISKFGVQIPLLVGYELSKDDGVAMTVFTGPQLRFGCRGDISVKNKVLKDELDDLNLWNGQHRFDLSWKIGVGFPVNDFVISLEADLGITDLLKNDFSCRENRLGLGLTYYF